MLYCTCKGVVDIQTHSSIKNTKKLEKYLFIDAIFVTMNHITINMTFTCGHTLERLHDIYSIV